MKTELLHQVTELLGKSVLEADTCIWCQSFNDAPLKEYPDRFGTGYAIYPNSGVELAANLDGMIESIVFFGPDDPIATRQINANGFSGELPLALDFNMTREHVHSKLKQPYKSFDDGDGLGDDLPTDVYRLSNCLVQIEYHPSGENIQRIAVSVDYART